MAVVRVNRALAIGERVEDVFRDFRTAEVGQSAANGAIVRILATGGGSDVFAEVFIGERPAMERAELSDETRTPQKPDDFLLEGEPAVPLERVRMSLDNQSGAARTAKLVLDIAPL